MDCVRGELSSFKQRPIGGTVMFSELLATTGDLQTYFEFGRVLTGPWDWILPLVVLFLLIWNTVVMVRRDCEELGGRPAAVLIGLRTLALFGLFLVYLEPQWRTTRDVTDRSQVFVLVDTSQSMGREDVPTLSGGSMPENAPEKATVASREARLSRIKRSLEAGPFLDQLRGGHDVFVYRFDEDQTPLAIATLPWLDPMTTDAVENETSADETSADETSADKERTFLPPFLMASSSTEPRGGAGLLTLERLGARARCLAAIIADAVDDAGHNDSVVCGLTAVSADQWLDIG